MSNLIINAKLMIISNGGWPANSAVRKFSLIAVCSFIRMKTVLLLVISIQMSIQIRRTLK